MSLVTLDALPFGELTPAKVKLQHDYRRVTGSKSWLLIRKNPKDPSDDHMPERATEAATFPIRLADRSPICVSVLLRQLFVGGVICCKAGHPFSVLNTAGDTSYRPCLFFRKSLQNLELHGEDTLLDVLANHFQQLLSMMGDPRALKEIQAFRTWASQNQENYNTLFKAIVTNSKGWRESMEAIPNYEVQLDRIVNLLAWLKAGNSPIERLRKTDNSPID